VGWTRVRGLWVGWGSFSVVCFRSPRLPLHCSSRAVRYLCSTRQCRAGSGRNIPCSDDQDTFFVRCTFHQPQQGHSPGPKSCRLAIVVASAKTQAERLAKWHFPMSRHLFSSSLKFAQANDRITDFTLMPSSSAQLAILDCNWRARQLALERCEIFANHGC
jgi:hypothetical protein